MMRTMTLDFFSADAMADHTVVTRQLLAGPRVQLFEGFDPPFYVVSRYKDIDEVLRQPDIYLSGKGQGPNFIEPAGVVSDPPQHTYFRKLVQDHFQPAAIAALEPRLIEIAKESLDSVADQEEWDLHDTLAFPLPIRIICEILGIPTDDIWQFKAWSDASVAALASDNPEAFAEYHMALRDYILGILEEKRRSPDETLLSRIANAEYQGEKVSDNEAISLTSQMFVAGNETTTSLITNFVWRMYREGHWEDFANGKIELDKAINESLRFDPPLLTLFRTTAREAELAGTTIPAGSKVMTYYAAANRDPEAFDNPDVFDPHRPAKRTMSFGLGIHFCLGSELAKLEARIALDALRNRYPNLQLVNDGVRIAPFLFWGRCKLPVRT